MKNRQATTLAGVGEDRAIAALVGLLGGMDAATVGPGDDCAVVPLPDTRWEWQLTSDPVVEGVHFLADAAPRLIGRKAVGRVLSDLAAMGGEPKWLLINISAPAHYPLDDLRSIYRGVNALARKYGAAVVGGDVGKGPALALHVFGIGQAPSGSSVRRAGAMPGDRLYVTGTLGGSGAGRHLTFEPRVREGIWLREHEWVRAMMDVSDGIARDLRRMLAVSGVGAVLYERSIPVSRAARAVAVDGRSPLAHALMDGEDFELLFTVPASLCSKFEAAWRRQFRLRCTCVGEITANREELLMQNQNGAVRVFTGDGFEHFAG